MSANPDDSFERLGLIYDYAKFHIGLYATVSTALVAIISFADTQYKRAYYGLFLAVFACFLVAGIGGGLVASHIAYAKRDATQSDKLLNGFTEPTLSSPLRWSRYKWFAIIEHYAFWLGVLIAAVGVISHLRD